MVLIFKGVSSSAYAVLWFAGTMRCPRAVRTGFVLLCEILTFPVLAFAGVSTHRKKCLIKGSPHVAHLREYSLFYDFGRSCVSGSISGVWEQGLSVFLDSLGNVCGFFNVVILLNNFKCSSYVYIIYVYLLKRKKKKSSNSFQKGKEIGRTHSNWNTVFPRDFHSCWSNSFFVFSV